MAYHKTMDHGQTHARALPRPFRSEERFKNVGKHIGRDTRASIAHSQPDVWAWREGGRGYSTSSIHLSRLETELQDPAGLTHGILGISTEVEQHLMHLRSIRQDGAGIGR